MNKPRYVQCFRVALRGSYIGSTFCLFAKKEIFNHNILTALSPVRNSCVTVWSTMGIEIIVLFTMWHFSPCSRRSLTCSCNIYIFFLTRIVQLWDCSLPPIDINRYLLTNQFIYWFCKLMDREHFHL